MRIAFLTPLGGLLALAALLPLAAVAAASARAERVRRVLGLTPGRRALRIVPAAAVVAAGGLVGLAAAQPVLDRTLEQGVRSDAEAFVVVDVSRSMLASRGPAAPTRIERAKSAALMLRSALPEVPVGVASLTDRVLPHLFPSADAGVFAATVERSLAIERPPPRSAIATNATSLDSLTALATRGFFSPEAKRRLAVVLTDGESQAFSVDRVGRRLRGAAAIGVVFVRFQEQGEEVYTNGVAEAGYRFDPSAAAVLEAVALSAGGAAYSEHELAAAGRRAREVIGEGETVVLGDRRSRLALAPYAALAAFVPLGLVLVRRGR